MTAPTDNEDEEAAKRRKKDDSGEGDSDSFGRGKAGAGTGGGIKISAQKLKQVMADWRHLDINEVAEAVAEFFGEVLRASAHIAVDFVTKSNVKAFAILEHSIKGGQKLAAARTRARVRSADAGGAFGGRGGRSSGGGQKVQPQQQKTPLTQKTPKQKAPNPQQNIGPPKPSGF